MNPATPDPKRTDPPQTDPFEGVVDDDDGIDWADDPPPADPVDVFAHIDDEDGTVALELAASITPPTTEVVDDEGGTDEFVLDGPSDEFESRVVLPWRTVATIDGVEVPTILSPSMPHSTWRGGPEDAAGQPTRVELEGLVLEVSLDIVTGAPTLVLGRDALEGRIRIDV